jgi:hypothetical protein
MTFREDVVGHFAFAVPLAPAVLETKLDKFNQVQADVAWRLADGKAVDDPHGLFEKINATATHIIGMRDQADLYGSLIASKVEGLVALCNRADSDVKSLDHPDNGELLDAFHDLWAASVALNKDLLSKNVELLTFTVPQLMGVGEISSAIYGNSSKGSDIMQLNALENPLAVPAATRVRYYPVAA